MKLKLSLLVGALALAVSAQANAGIAGAATATGGDLILSVWDQTNTTSYTEDLGVSMAAFLAAPNSQSWAADANMTSFLAGVAATDVTSWNVVAQKTGGVTLTGYTFLTTSTATTAPTGPTNTVLKSFNSGPDTYMAAANAAAGTATSITAASPAAAYAGGTTFANNFGGKANTFTNDAAIGTSQNFFNLTGSSTLGSAKANVSQFTNAAGASTFTLASNGTLSYAGTVAAVPEPGEWALMLSGFGLIGFVAARRKKMNTGMTFA